MTENNSEKLNSIYNRLATARLGTMVPTVDGATFQPFSYRFMRITRQSDNDVTITIAGPDTNRKMWLKMATTALRDVTGVTIVDGGERSLLAGGILDLYPAGP